MYTRNAEMLLFVPAGILMYFWFDISWQATGVTQN